MHQRLEQVVNVAVKKFQTIMPERISKLFNMYKDSHSGSVASILFIVSVQEQEIQMKGNTNSKRHTNTSANSIQILLKTIKVSTRTITESD